MQLTAFRGAWVAAFAFAVGCNSASSFDEIGPSTGFSVPGGDTAPSPPGEGPPIGAFAPACPEDRPEDGMDCFDLGSGVQCEYGNAADPSCNTLVQCGATGWRTMHESTCNFACGAFDDRRAGDPCDDPNVRCSWVEGTCGCVFPRADGGGGDGGAGVGDAGVAKMGTWQCAQPELGCPAKRPLRYSSCVKSMICDYGSCLFDDPLLVMSCESQGSQGTWGYSPAPSCE